MKITFHGGTREVGGSCVTLETKHGKVSLDYGIKIGEETSPSLPKDLDAAIISHAHLDHSGSLLDLKDTNISIIGSKATRDVTTELLKDLIRVQRMNGKDIPYFSRDVSKVKRLWWPTQSTALPGMEIQLLPAGHVLGANMIAIYTENKTILYTGDFCLHDTEILEGSILSDLPKQPDVLIMESTYGGETRPQRDVLIKQFFAEIQEAMDRKGNILIPAFAFHRSQEMAKRLDQAMKLGILPSYNIYYISGLAYRITKYFNEHKGLLNNEIQMEDEPFTYEHIKRLRRIDQIDEPAVVICTSGFGHAGASRKLLAEWASDERNTVIINSGYIPPDSPLHLSKVKGEFFENGEKITVKADVEHIELSGHADQRELVTFVKTLKPKRTFLVHGSLDQETALSTQIAEFTSVEIPEKLDTYTA